MTKLIMFILHNVFLLATIALTNCQQVEILRNTLDGADTLIKIVIADELLTRKKFTEEADKPTLQLYYESLCPGCIELDSTEFKTVVQLLHEYVEIHTYPYGNARTIHNNDGTVEVHCQHGPEECYGNKLHGCALNILANATEALLFNACMIQQDSNDKSADTCGKQMNIEVNTIKECAKGRKGDNLLLHYGEESKKVNFRYVPYVLLNGNEWRSDKDDLFKAVCAALTNPPEPCRNQS